MNSTTAQGRLAVIGVGPRALGALEALADRIADLGRGLEVDLFDPQAFPGAGPNFSPDQHPLCLLNIPVRSISIAASDGPGIAGRGIADGLGGTGRDPERYPPRAELGGHLAARMAALVGSAPAGLRFRHRPVAVTAINREEGGWWLACGDRRHGPYDEILLTPGQPATVPDRQLARWQDHARTIGADLLAAYPADRLLDAAETWAGRNVAVRGLGLATLDVLRILSCGLGGRFEDGRYHPSGREPARILPFSLDGQPPVPKPANAGLDTRFEPRPDETSRFRDGVRAAASQAPEAALDGICEALLDPAMRILAETGGTADRAVLADWLAVERDHPGSQDTRSATEALRACIAEARGAVPPSVGYVVGQLMRKWQNALRQGFNPAPAAPGTAAAIIGFDEGLKRFSYGPPVSSAVELLILIEAGLVDPRAAADPDIRLTGDGWQLIEDDMSARVTAMVDAVLPSPDLSRLAGPLMTGLIADGRLIAVGEKLGARIRPDGSLIAADGTAQPGLCLLGRLAQGSVIAVDSIHDCFGAAAERWAGGVVRRLRGNR